MIPLMPFQAPHKPAQKPGRHQVEELSLYQEKKVQGRARLARLVKILLLLLGLLYFFR